MKTFRVLFAATICACATTSFAQTPAPAQAAKPTDIYHCTVRQGCARAGRGARQGASGTGPRAIR